MLNTDSFYLSDTGKIDYLASVLIERDKTQLCSKQGLLYAQLDLEMGPSGDLLT